MKDLGGIVKSNKRTYRIEVKARPPKPDGRVELDHKIDVTVFDNDSGKRIKTETFVMQPHNTNADLRAFVEITKDSAKRDFA